LIPDVIQTFLQKYFHRGSEFFRKPLISLIKTFKTLLTMENHNSSQTDNDEIVKRIYQIAVDLLVNQQKPAYEVRNALIEMGLDTDSAVTVVKNIENEVSKSKQSQANKDILFGSLWLAGGTLVTVISMSSASGGGRYIITWGAILFGAIQLIKGLINKAGA